MSIDSRRFLQVLPALALAGALSGCVGFPGGYPGGGYGSPDGYGYPDRGYGMQSVSGTVQAFDPSGGRLLLSSDSGYGGGYGGSGVEVWVGRDTRLFYQGREQNVAGLERGDRVRIDVQDSGGRLWARTIEVTQNVREVGGGYGDPYGGGYGGTGLEGAVRYVDLGRRTIEITRGGYSGQVERVWFDQRTRFDYRGQAVSPGQLEPGDIVRIDAQRSGNGWLATYVSVVQSVRSR